MAAWPRDSGPVILGKLRIGAKVGGHQRKSRHYVTISSSQTAELRGKPGTGRHAPSLSQWPRLTRAGGSPPQMDTLTQTLWLIPHFPFCL